MSAAGCTGKAGYLSWDSAKKAISRNSFHPDARQGFVTIYRCRACHFWHIGKSTIAKKPK